MEAAARASAQSIWDIAAHYTAAFKENIAGLSIRDSGAFFRWRPIISSSMIAFAEKIAPAHCYELESGLYFDVSTVPDYGRLARVADDEREGGLIPSRASAIRRISRSGANPPRGRTGRWNGIAL